MVDVQVSIGKDTDGDESSIEIDAPSTENKLQTKVQDKTTEKVPMPWEESDSDDDFLELLQRSKNAAARLAARKRPSPHAKPQRTTSPSAKATSRVANPYSNQSNQARAARLNEKYDAAARKQREKSERAKVRKAQQEARARQKEEDRIEKKKKLMQADQSKGKFAHKEIILLMDPEIYNSDVYALEKAVSEDFLVRCYPSALTCKRAVQWVQRNYLLGGAEEALKLVEKGDMDQVDHSPYISLILEGDDFIPLITRPEGSCDEDDDFPELAKWLDRFVRRWKYVWETTKEPRMVILLSRVPEALDQMWVDHRRHNRRKNDSNPRLPSTFDLQDAIQWLLIQFQVDCIHCKTVEEIQGNIHKLTRGICETPYAEQVTELHCCKKIKTGVKITDSALVRARDTWIRQLQQIPRLSEPMARNVARHFPTMHSLVETYRCGTDYQNQELLAGILTGTSRQMKLSEWVHRIMTSSDANEMIV